MLVLWSYMYYLNAFLQFLVSLINEYLIKEMKYPQKTTFVTLKQES